MSKPTGAAPKRLGLVLGGGGVIAQAFHAGLLAAMEDVLGFDARMAAVIVGTSAGAPTGALLRAGFTGRDLVKRACGEPPDDRVAPLLNTLGPPLDIDELRSRRQARRGRPPEALQMLTAAARRPWRTRLGVLAAAVLPEGAIPSSLIAEPYDRLYGGTWPEQPLWLCAVRLDNGTRVVFGKRGEAEAPSVSVGTAVAASCAVPGFYSPVSAGGLRFVDGGVWSPTNADVLADHGLDSAIISSPMTSAQPATLSLDAPMRMLLRNYVLREMATLRRRGIPTALIEPTRADVLVMGSDHMDPSRRAPVTKQVVASVTSRLHNSDLRHVLAAIGIL